MHPIHVLEFNKLISLSNPDILLLPHINSHINNYMQSLFSGGLLLDRGAGYSYGRGTRGAAVSGSGSSVGAMLTYYRYVSLLAVYSEPLIGECR